MTNRQLLAARVAADHCPRLFAFAYPRAGRGVAVARQLALRVWCLSLRWRLLRSGLLL